MSATVAYLKARDVVGRPASDRENRLLEALEEALLARFDAEEERDTALDELFVLGKKHGEAQSNFECTRDELRDAEKSLADETRRADDAEDALRRALKDEEGIALIDALAGKREAETGLAAAKETIAKLESEKRELLRPKPKGRKIPR